MTALSHTWYLTDRHLRFLLRQPAFVGFTLVVPIIYVLLFGALFTQVANIPGFGSADYLTFLLPGVVMMTAMNGAGWTGMGIVDDLSHGITDRLLVSPLWRPAEVGGRLAQLAIVTVIQAVFVLGIGLLRGAGLSGGIAGVGVLLLAAVLLAAVFGALSCAMGITLKQRESLIGMNQFLVLPLTFLASAFMPRQLMPGWIQGASRANPLEWAVSAAREAMATNPDWGAVGVRLGALLLLAVAMAWLATGAFRAYQRAA